MLFSWHVQPPERLCDALASRAGCRWLAREDAAPVRHIPSGLQALGEIEELNSTPCIVCPWHYYHISLKDGEKWYQGTQPDSNGKLQPGAWKRYPSVKAGRGWLTAGVGEAMPHRSSGCSLPVLPVALCPPCAAGCL